VRRGGPSSATGMLWAERFNKLAKNITRATHGWANGFADRWGQRRSIYLRRLLAHPHLADPPPYLSDIPSIWLSDQPGAARPVSLSSLPGWSERLSQLWSEVLGDLPPGREQSDELLSYDSVVIGGVLFRTLSSQRTLSTDNSGIIMPIVFDDDTTVDRFGELRGIYLHEREAGGPKAVFLDVLWLKFVRSAVGYTRFVLWFPVSILNSPLNSSQEQGRVSIVRRVANSADNTGGRNVVFAHEIYPQNVIFWPDKPYSAPKGDQWAIFREADTRIQWKLDGN
jgi:hypothetical protein